MVILGRRLDGCSGYSDTNLCSYFLKHFFNRPLNCFSIIGHIKRLYEYYVSFREGCLLSSLLFVLFVEIMASRLRSNTDFKGIKIKLDCESHSIKISQLADDTTLFCCSKYDVQVAMNEIEICVSYSRLKLNRNKTEGGCVGS